MREGELNRQGGSTRQTPESHASLEGYLQQHPQITIGVDAEGLLSAWLLRAPYRESSGVAAWATVAIIIARD